MTRTVFLGRVAPRDEAGETTPTESSEKIVELKGMQGTHRVYPVT